MNLIFFALIFKLSADLLNVFIYCYIYALDGKNGVRIQYNKINSKSYVKVKV